MVYRTDHDNDDEEERGAFLHLMGNGERAACALLFERRSREGACTTGTREIWLQQAPNRPGSVSRRT